jgi:hypothetical protein
MAGDVASELAAAAVPASVAGVGLGLEAGTLAKVVEHAVGLELEEVVGVEVLRMLERAAGEAHGGQRKRWSGERHGFGAGGRGSGGEREGEREEAEAAGGKGG